MQREWLWAALVSAGLLAACGGSGGDEPTPAPANPGSSGLSVQMSGTAAKGLMANADVTAHAVRADGTVDSAVLASTTTDANGRYTLSFQGVQAQPYVIKVTAKAGTMHFDEVANDWKPLPAGFTLRSVFVPSGSGTVSTSMNVTPFSEMAVAAAAKAQGGLNGANVAQARSNVVQLLGFDPTAVDVKTIGAATTVEQQKLGVLLTAVSQLAHDGALGCVTGSDAEKTRCVVEALGAASSTGTLKLTQGSTDVSAALARAARAVLASPQLNPGGKVPDVVLANVLAKLNCSGSSCAPADAGTVPPANPTGPAIAAAKQLFNSLRSDWRELFASGNATNPSAFEVQASRFEESMRGVQAPVEMLVKDAGVILMGIDLYNDFKAGRTTQPWRGRAAGAFVDNFASGYYGYYSPSAGYNAVSCQLTQDSAGATVASTAANANFISCRASYYVGPSSFTPSYAYADFAHGFTLTPASTAGQFAYQSRSRYRPLGAPSSTTMPGTALYGGNVSTTADAQGRVTGFSITGELPGAFASGGTTLVNTSHRWNLSGTRSLASTQAVTDSLSGEVVARNADGSTQSTLQIKSGSVTQLPVARDAADNIVAPGSSAAVAAAGTEVGAATLNVVWATPGAEFEGRVAATEPAWDKSQTLLAPTRLEIAGALRTVNGASKTEFFAGSFTLGLAGLAAYDQRQPHGADNFVTLTGSLQGKATAPSRPQLELGVATSVQSHLRVPSVVVVDYRSVVNGKPKLAVSVSASRNDAGALVLNLSEATAGLAMSVTENDATADLKLNNGSVIGRLERNGRMTYVDGSFESLY
ncbi:hypothetical protein [Azohydromonas caseinilytica]|uniref:Carboxypeptidase regulatory-like domain-containing protein n=1 Tax=Azohydromonas caseinilytica TaxID=2728836 RepID=A0A848F900_9BURK|nr:hypothetical protein [Azohydromonas caseinilytica]NML14969.1 hypothetical protein [Azohydromonas caseinilytica]